MLGKIIISIIFIPINAMILWVASSIGGERQSYNKALIATSLLFFISLLNYIPFQGQGFHGTWIRYFLGSWHFRSVFSGFILWFVYRYDWKSLLLMWFIWNLLQIPFNILQTKILTLPWDSMMQAF